MKKPFVLCSLTLLTLCLTGCGEDSSSSSNPPVASSSQERSVLTPSKIYAEVNKSTVFILIEKLDGYASGTGFFIDDEGTFVTNYHVIEDGKAGAIADYQGNPYTIDYVKGYDEGLDIAICASSAVNTYAATLGNSDKVSVGDTVYAIGYPAAFKLGASSSTFTSGMVSMNRSVGGYSYIQATVDITNGNSGGPLINDYGEVIGITTAGIKYNDIDYMNLSVPISRISIVSRDGKDSIYTVTKRHYNMPVKLYVDGQLKTTLQIPYGQTASLPSYSQDGHTFDGWYTDSACTKSFSSNSAITDPMSLYARFVPNQYKIHLDPNGGAVSSQTIDVTFGSSYSLPEPTREGYSFLGWARSSDGGAFASSGTYNVVGNLSLKASWSANSYSITYYLNGGENSSCNPDVYTPDSDAIVLKDANRDGYSFEGWYSDSSLQTRVYSIPSGHVGDVSLYAKWKAKKYTLLVTSEDESKGTVSYVGEGYTDETITVSARSTTGLIFKGWYEKGAFVSEKNPYTFTMPSKNVSLVAKFTTETEEKARRQALGIDPVIDAVTNTLTYGLYPQKRVSDMTTLNLLNALTTVESNGWCLLDGVYYAKKSATPCDSSYVFDDGTKIVSGTTYWFKCEPITWKILSSGNGEYSLLSTVLLDAHHYNEFYTETKNGYYANNYEQSEIREWLNNGFYNSAFSLGNSLIQTTSVDNSVATVDSSSNKYTCNDTEDKVYLLSYQDYKNTSYFIDSTARQCETTDWARANGAYCNTNSSYLYNGRYWTRSPYYSTSCGAWIVFDDGGALFLDRVDYSLNAVRPSLRIKIASESKSIIN